ncbi:MAG: DNA recombination/repair protein RecA [Candidatus Parcubacteria bacterium]|nr:MAG: DNA recombination/repair protein RecA [Candidatus Parcubacteria bacterium]
MKKTNKQNSQKNLDSLLEEIKKEFGDGSVMTLETVPRVDVEVISTGAPSLDLALGVGGLPRGRIVEIFGPESSGKTTVALETAAEVQKNNGQVAFIDTEHALDPEYAKKIGVNIEKMVISQPDSGEDALNIVEKLVKSGLFDLIIVDSVAALVPRAELEGEIGDQFIGLQARMLSQALRKLTGIISKTRTIVIFINQTRAMIGGMIPGQETTTGGKALKFYASIRIELKRITQIKRGDEIIGNKIRAKIVKNKVAPPFKVAELDIYYSEGISYEADLINLGEKLKIIEKSGNSYIFQGTKLGGSFQAAREFLKENPEVAKKIYQEILKTNK